MLTPRVRVGPSSLLDPAQFRKRAARGISNTRRYDGFATLLPARARKSASTQGPREDGVIGVCIHYSFHAECPLGELRETARTRTSRQHKRNRL